MTNIQLVPRYFVVNFSSKGMWQSFLIGLSQQFLCFGLKGVYLLLS